jgi:epoxide hydrolase-like predicted phosphatase
MKIKALIFDLGGVVIDCSFDKTFDNWATVTGRYPDEIKGLFKFSDSFEKFERNDITTLEFIDSVSQQLNYKFDYSTFEKGWNAIFINTISDIDNLLIALKKHYRLVALTNTNTVHAKVWTKKYAGTLRHFEKIFCSHEIRTSKPETKAFQMVLDYLNLSPKETIFLDDKEEYIKGAIQLGINTILVVSYNQMLRGLEKFGVRI